MKTIVIKAVSPEIIFKGSTAFQIQAWFKLVVEFINA